MTAGSAMSGTYNVGIGGVDAGYNMDGFYNLALGGTRA